MNRRSAEAYKMNILPCISGKESSNGSIRSNISDTLEIFWETARIIRWPINSSCPNLRNKCCTENWASEQSTDPAYDWTKSNEQINVKSVILGAHTWLRKFIVCVQCGLLRNKMTKITKQIYWCDHSEDPIKMKHDSKEHVREYIDMIFLWVRI